MCLIHQSPPSHHVSWLLREEPLGIAVRREHPLADSSAYRIGDLHSLRVLVHARERTPAQQEGLMAAISAADVRPHWQFAQFTEHALACAMATRSDAVMVGSHTAALQLPGWRWGPLEGLPQAVMTTWLVRQRQTRAVVQEVADVGRTVGE
ncbi:hypothetical protein [Streptosporangium roseum]|uniref:hypothetical protein n=1 Tax=Streptosporangium roseum TaxID=2001 RepID=UPI003328D5CB